VHLYFEDTIPCEQFPPDCQILVQGHSSDQRLTQRFLLLDGRERMVDHFIIQARMRLSVLTDESIGLLCTVSSIQSASRGYNPSLPTSYVFHPVSRHERLGQQLSCCAEGFYDWLTRDLGTYSCTLQ
jgi:hypothetical protein